MGSPVGSSPLSHKADWDPYFNIDNEFGNNNGPAPMELDNYSSEDESYSTAVMGGGRNPIMHSASQPSGVLFSMPSHSLSASFSSSSQSSSVSFSSPSHFSSDQSAIPPPGSLARSSSASLALQVRGLKPKSCGVFSYASPPPPKLYQSPPDKRKAEQLNKEAQDNQRIIEQRRLESLLERGIPLKNSKKGPADPG